MFQNAPMMLGQYRPLDHFLHRLDARAKMLPVTLVLVLALMTEAQSFYVACMALLVIALLNSGISPSALLRNLRPVLALVLVTAGYHLIFTGHSEPPLFSVFGLSVSEMAVHSAVFYSLRLILFVSMAFLVTLTTSPSELAESFAKLLSPLQRLRLPVSDLTLILFMAIRFIPVLYEEFAAIRHAQMIRGVVFSGSIVNRLRKTTSIIIPVFVAAVQRADDLALAITARGYDQRKRRTFYTHTHFGWTEWVFVFVSMTLISILFVVSR